MRIIHVALLLAIITISVDTAHADENSLKAKWRHATGRDELVTSREIQGLEGDSDSIIDEIVDTLADAKKVMSTNRFTDFQLVPKQMLKGISVWEIGSFAGLRSGAGLNIIKMVINHFWTVNPVIKTIRYLFRLTFQCVRVPLSYTFGRKIKGYRYERCARRINYIMTGQDIQESELAWYRKALVRMRADPFIRRGIKLLRQQYGKHKLPFTWGMVTGDYDVEDLGYPYTSAALAFELVAKKAGQSPFFFHKAINNLESLALRTVSKSHNFFLKAVYRLVGGEPLSDSTVKYFNKHARIIREFATKTRIANLIRSYTYQRDFYKGKDIVKEFENPFRTDINLAKIDYLRERVNVKPLYAVSNEDDLEGGNPEKAKAEEEKERRTFRQKMERMLKRNSEKHKIGGRATPL